MVGRPRFLAPLPVDIATQWLDEPQLAFHHGGRHDDPKTGVTLYGPVGMSNGTHREQVHVGLIGTEAGVRGARELLEAYAAGVPGDESITPFPGCDPSTGYRCALEFSDKTTQSLTLNELRQVVETKKSRDRFEAALLLLDDKFRIVTGRDAPLDYVMVVIPDDLYRRARATDYRDGGPVEVSTTRQPSHGTSSPASTSRPAARHGHPPGSQAARASSGSASTDLWGTRATCALLSPKPSTSWATGGCCAATSSHGTKAGTVGNHICLLTSPST